MRGGFSTGNMYAFWGFAMQGGAVRKQSPQRFWIYALANIAVLLNAALVVAGIILPARVVRQDSRRRTSSA